MNHTKISKEVEALGIDFYWRDTGAVAKSPKPNTKEYEEAMNDPMLIRED